MAKFKAFLKQDGGCDYTIGCGRNIIDIEADSLEMAKINFIKIIKENYNSDEVYLSSAEIYEIASVTQVDVDVIYEELRKNENSEIERMILERERIEFERLKKKFGN